MLGMLASSSSSSHPRRIRRATMYSVGTTRSVPMSCPASRLSLTLANHSSLSLKSSLYVTLRPEAVSKFGRRSPRRCRRASWRGVRRRSLACRRRPPPRRSDRRRRRRRPPQAARRRRAHSAAAAGQRPPAEEPPPAHRAAARRSGSRAASWRSRARVSINSWVDPVGPSHVVGAAELGVSPRRTSRRGRSRSGCRRRAARSEAAAGQRRPHRCRPGRSSGSSTSWPTWATIGEPSAAASDRRTSGPWKVEVGDPGLARDVSASAAVGVERSTLAPARGGP